jgi:hypothetical protein
MFEDYGNGIRNDRTLVEAIDIIREAREMAQKETVVPDKKQGKKAYKKALAYNEEIEISKMVCDELEKFSHGLYKSKYLAYQTVYKAGLSGLYNADMAAILEELKAARAMPKTNKEEKELRKFAIEIAQNKRSSLKAISKYYKNFSDFVQPDFAELEIIFKGQDACDEELKKLYLIKDEAKKATDSFKLKEVGEKIKAVKAEKKALQKKEKDEMDKHAQFARAAKPYLDAERLMKEKENQEHFDELAASYEEAKANEAAALQAQLDEQKRLEDEKAATKAAYKAGKKNK